MTAFLVFRPPLSRKYLRDGDRQVLAKRAFFLTVKVLEDNLNSLTGVRKPQPPPSSHPSGRFYQFLLFSRCLNSLTKCQRPPLWGR